MSDLLPPHERADSIGRAETEARLRAQIDEGALTHGWLITGPKGAGKATLAYRLARALLDPAALSEKKSLAMPADARTFRLVAGRAHPDLFVAARKFDEKADRYETEISVETIRALTGFLNRTASMGGARVAIVDTADEMNRNAANALLKALEEPPANAALLLLSASPGRLLATIRSRCRRIELSPVADAEIAAFVARETDLRAGDADAIARAARGRPGYALALAAGEGAEAIAAGREFLLIAAAGGDVSPIVSRLAGRAADERWDIFLPYLLDRIADAARRRARGATPAAPFERAEAGDLVDLHAEAALLSGRGEGVNLDRAQLIMALARMLARALGARAA